MNCSRLLAGLCQRIAESLGLSEPDVDIAWLLGMLHDIGRFEQIRRFGTFNDAQSVDHAEFGADLLFKEGLIRKFAEGYYEECELARSGNEEDEQIIKNNEHHNKDTGLLEMAIRQHNKYRVKEDLTERQRMFCDILRDADKVDIFKVNADIPMEIIYDVTTEELKNGIITKEVLESFYKKETVLKSVRRSAVDHIVGHISLLFELVYKESYRQAKEQGYVYKLLDFKSDVPEVNAEFDDMRKYVDEFLMEI
jgi:HD-GYP domain-containing protein (c-di-GMP phosphodiesterase class II)